MFKIGDEVLGGRVTRVTALGEGLEVIVVVPHAEVEETPAPAPAVEPEKVAEPAAEDEKPASTGDAVKKTTTVRSVRK